jgi:hypothetical protein
VGQIVLLDGSGSHDPDAGPGPLTYEWTLASVPTASALQNEDILGRDQAEASFVPDVVGTYRLRLRVSDGQDLDEAVLEVVVPDPNVPPNADAGQDQTAILGGEVELDGTGSNDPDNGPVALTFNWHFVSTPHTSTLTDADIMDGTAALASFEPDVEGSYVLQLEVFDGVASDFDNVLVRITCVQDVTAQPNTLWPPNHKMVPVTVSVAVSDMCTEAPACQIFSVRSDEPVNGLGDGDTAPDWKMTGDLTVNLRAERSGTGVGRVFSFGVRCTETDDHSTIKTTTVTVPHSRKKEKSG